MISSRNALLALLVGLGLSSSVFAGASNKNPNPFGNGSYFSQNGTFSAVLRSPEQPNFLGVVQVSTTTASYNSTNVTNGAPGTGWATVFTPAIPNYENVVASSGIQRVTNQVPATTNSSVSMVTNVLYTNAITNAVVSFVTNTNYTTQFITNQVFFTNNSTASNVTITNTIVTPIIQTNYSGTNLVTWRPFSLTNGANSSNIAIVYVTNVIALPASTNYSFTNITTNYVSTNVITVITTNGTNLFTNLITNNVTSSIVVSIPVATNISVTLFTNVFERNIVVPSLASNAPGNDTFLTYYLPVTNAYIVTNTSIIYYTNNQVSNIVLSPGSITNYLITNQQTVVSGTTVQAYTNIINTVLPTTNVAAVTNVVTNPAYTYIGPDTNIATVTVTNVYTNAYLTNVSYQLATNQTFYSNNNPNAPSNSPPNYGQAIGTNTVVVIGLTNIVFTNYWTNITITNYGSVGVVYSTNYINVPGIQWNGSAFGVINNNNNSIAVTYTLSSSVSQVYTNNNNITQLSLTNLNGGGQFSASFQNSYPNQTFSGSGYCSVQPTIGGNPSNSSPILNFTNTVSGFRLSY